MRFSALQFLKLWEVFGLRVWLETSIRERCKQPGICFSCSVPRWKQLSARAWCFGEVLSSVMMMFCFFLLAYSHLLFLATRKIFWREKRETCPDASVRLHVPSSRMRKRTAHYLNLWSEVIPPLFLILIVYYKKLRIMLAERQEGYFLPLSTIKIPRPAALS